jgi:serine/threonine protein kinase
MEPRDLVGDRFEIQEQMKAGGMGEVFRARDRVSDRAVAVKVLSDGRDHRNTRFEREVELLSELSHPGIVRYISHGATPSGSWFLVMEWLDGEDLKARLDRASLTMSEAVTLATRVAEALGAAHAASCTATSSRVTCSCPEVASTRSRCSTSGSRRKPGARS